MSTSASAAVQEPYVTENGKYRKIRSVTDIDWRRPLHEQLEPNLKGGPRSSRTPADLSMLRAKIPKLTKHLFDGLFPADLWFRSTVAGANYNLEWQTGSWVHGRDVSR